MQDTARYVKTEKGATEISKRRNNLKGRVRTMLILIDPAKNASELRRQAVQLGLGADVLEQLLHEGYIEPVGAAAQPHDISTDELMRFREAKAFMNETVVDALGIRAFGFTLRLERCATRPDLAAMVPEYEKLIAKKRERGEASLLVARMRELLA